MTLSRCPGLCKHGKQCRRFPEHPGIHLFNVHDGGDECGVYPTTSDRPTREDPPVVDNPKFQIRVTHPMGDAIAEILEAVAALMRERAKSGEPYIGLAFY